MNGVWLLICVHLRLTQAGAVADLKLPALFKQIYVGQIARTNKTCGTTNTATYHREAVEFPCSDVTCEGWLYRPKRSIAGSSKPPVIVMGHGMGGEKAFLDIYASRFAEIGFAVFTFDYRCWGDSDGSPRRSIDPLKQVDDWVSAVKFVQTNVNEVDSAKLSLWGTSFAGGHVITVAAKLGDQVKSVIAQVGSQQTSLMASFSLKLQTQHLPPMWQLSSCSDNSICIVQLAAACSSSCCCKVVSLGEPLTGI